MDLATGAMASLLPKLVELLQDEYKLQTGVKKDVEFLSKETKSMDAALRKVARVPRDQLDEQVKIWADHVRELSYEMEDLVDSFLVRVEGAEDTADPDSFKGFMKKVASLFKKGKTRHQIADAIKEIKDQVQEVAARRDRYKVDEAASIPAASATDTIDPRVLALFKDQRELVGIEKPKEEIIKILTYEDTDVSPNSKHQQLKMLSIFGFGGLGKTTLAKSVYDKLRAEFICSAFVSVGQNPNVKKVLLDILRQLDKDSYLNATMLDEGQLIGELRGLLEDKRYLIVIDDIWDIKLWEIIRCTCVESNNSSIIITTTRILEVAEESDHVYKHMPLSCDDSRELFYKRLSVGKGKSSYDQSVEISEKILRKCGGVPLAIITIASLLAGKQKEHWSDVYSSIGFAHGDNIHVENTRKILLYSYYDLPSHLKTCLLHLSIYPQDHVIKKNTLIWKWVAEGFVEEVPGVGLFELGEIYFNELINRSMIQPIEVPYRSIITGCRLHDLVLDMIHCLSKEENFVTVFDGNERCASSQISARRLAIQMRVTHDEQQEFNLGNKHMAQVRSFNATMCHLGTMPSLSCFLVLRVLALEGCTFAKDRTYHLEHLGKLLQLRYLGLSDMPITRLPEEIGDLRFLQTLNLRETKIKDLPRRVRLLRQLRCLHLSSTSTGLSGWIRDPPAEEDLPLSNVSPEIERLQAELEELMGFPIPSNSEKLQGMQFASSSTGTSGWIGELTSLEELSMSSDCPDYVKEIGKLTELRELKTKFAECDDKSFVYLMDSLSNLQKLQSMHLFSGSYIVWANCEGYAPPRHLRQLELHRVQFHRLPAWVDSSRLPHLSALHLEVKAVEARDVEILGRFPELITLALCIGDDSVFPDIPGGGAFPKLRSFVASAHLRFLQGAMPSLEHVHSLVDLKVVEAGTLDRGFASMVNLPRLEKIQVHMIGPEANKEEGESALRLAIKAHPNSPTIENPYISIAQDDLNCICD